MRPFEHLSPASLEEAVEALAAGSARPMAGGTDVVGEMKDEIHGEYPRLVVDLKAIPGLEYVRSNGRGLEIGALTKLSALAGDSAVQERYPALAEAASSIASPQIRQMGTVAGNICQSTRCWYYWTPDNRFDCTRKGGGTCYALAGDNRYHSVFGGVRFRVTPCVEACPVDTAMPSYLPYVRDGDVATAARLLLAHNPMPAVTGRVCPHFCQSECNRAQVDETVSIRAVERSLGDFILDHWEDIGPSPAVDTGKRVAVVGAGPAGLSAAYYLRLQGHEVVVLDRLDHAGGMLNHVIPRYRLPDDVVDRHVDILRRLGIDFHLAVELGRDFRLEELRSEYDAVFLATGTWEEKHLGIGEGPEVISGLEFLARARSGMEQGRGGGGHTLVIGGGSVAIDAAMTAKRLGTGRVTLACLESFAEMPALREDVEAAVEEGIEIMPSCGPARILESQGRADGMELVACTAVFDANGAFAPTFDLDDRKTVAADSIVVAIGQLPDLSALKAELPEGAFEGSLVKVDPLTQETGIPGLYAGGDLATGPGFVVSAIASGRRAAMSIGRYLGGKTGENEVSPPEVEVEEFCASSFTGDAVRAVAPALRPDARSMEGEDVSGLTPHQVQTEAERCMSCSCVSVNSSDLAPVLVVLGARIRTTKRVIDAAKFFAVGVGTSAVLDDDEIVTRVEVPEPASGSRSAFLKFALRNSIDFPVVNCAATIVGGADSVESASICLNAVYGRPYVPIEAERFLIGKTIDAETASRAGELAVDGGMPQSGNSYKLQIARALVERCILACSDHDT